MVLQQPVRHLAHHPCELERVRVHHILKERYFLRLVEAVFLEDADDLVVAVGAHQLALLGVRLQELSFNPSYIPDVMLLLRK